MKLASVLSEKVVASVHVNADKNLFVISKLVKKNFGLSYFRNEYGQAVGTCLLAAVLYGIEAMADVPARTLASRLVAELKSVNKLHGHSGVTLDDVLAFFKKPFTLGQYTYHVDASVSELRTVDAAIAEVKRGQPVILITDSHDEDTVSDRVGKGSRYRPVDTDNMNLRPIKTNTYELMFHSMMIIGYDAGHDWLLLRDNRATDFGSYRQLPAKPLRKAPEHVKMIAVHVDNVTKTRAQQAA